MRTRTVVFAALFVALAACGSESDAPPAQPSSAPTASTTAPAAPTSTTAPPPVNIYEHIGPDELAPSIAGDAARVYVPNGRSDTVTVIDPASRTVIDTVATSVEPQHIVPSYDLKTLWELDNQGNQVVPISASTGERGTPISVEDPYNLYFTPDGSSAIVVAEAFRRLDFRDPHTMELTGSLEVPGCGGINHADYDGAGTYLLATCEFAGRIAKIDMATRTVVGLLDLTANPVAGQPAPMPMRMPNGDVASYMPQDVRTAPNGHDFYVADMMAGGLFVIEGGSFTVTQFIPTGIGTHGITPSRDGTRLYVSNRGSDSVFGGPHGPGSVSVLDVATNPVVATWEVPGGGSPDMGNLNAAGTELWLSGRFDAEVYVFDTVNGGLAARIPVGEGPHGLTVWPQPGRFSLGHTGNMR
jgi:YVTN family beta-propeller protein